MIKLPRLSNRAAELLANRIPAAEPKLTVKANDNGEADVMLYDEIGVWGTSAKLFAEQINTLDAKTIHLRINSPGGDVFDGIAMYNALKRKSASAKIITHIEGLAASAASIVAMAGDEVRMNQGAFLMVHNAWGVAMGNAGEMRELADLLDKIDASLADIYAKRTGRKAETWAKYMAAETWFDADDAVEAKLADAIEDSAAANAAFDLSLFNNTPDTLRCSQRPKLDTERDIERFLRDEGGLSHAEAKKRIAALRSPRLRDEDVAEVAGFVRSFRP